MQLTKVETERFIEAIQDDEEIEWWCTDRAVVKAIFEWVETWVALGKPDTLTSDEIWEFKLRKLKLAVEGDQ